jgi:alpha-ketoglutarate-dependent taurine dioxygenase
MNSHNTMGDTKLAEPSQRSKAFPRSDAGRPKTVRISQDALVEASLLSAEDRFIWTIEPQAEAFDLLGWVPQRRSLIQQQLIEHGGILFRRSGADSPEAFAQVASAIAPDLIVYQERAAPRTEVARNVYTSTEFASDQYIPLHHEMSYSHNWPKLIFFYCDQPPLQGGRTPLANERKVYPRIDPGIRRRFVEHGVMYVRNYRPEIDPWQEAFQSTEHSPVEEYCKRWNIAWEWLDGDRLRTRQVRQATAIHPTTGETVWFNHAHMFHHSNLEPEQRETLLGLGTEADLPRNAYYGDGSEIDPSALDEIRSVYRENAVSFPWERGDILLLDNFLASHGREPFSGPRRILVAMADLFTNTEKRS